VSGTADAARGPGGATSLTAQEALAAVLALIAGYVDAYTFLNYQVYGSFMSGNTTQTGLHAGQGGLAVAGYNLLPIPLFVAGVFAGTLIWHSALAQASRWSPACSRLGSPLSPRVRFPAGSASSC
jgi:uncharacterized membrane protein YoaK (UPF0700 family)